MRKPLAAGVVTLAVLLSLGLAACGSDSSSDEVLNNEELIAKADEICTTYNERLTTVTDEASLGDSSTEEDITNFISDEIVPLYEDQLDEMKSLKPNEEDADAYNDITSTLETELQAVKDDPAAALNSSDPFAGASRKAREFGLEVCGSN